MKFKYSEYAGFNNVKIYRPTVPIIFKHRSKFVHTEAIIDSGSDHTILPIEIAGFLEIKLNPHKKTSFYGAGNNLFTVYPSPVSIELILRQGELSLRQWKTKVFFAEAQPAILLGQKGFLEKFKITFDGKKKETEIN